MQQITIKLSSATRDALRAEARRRGVAPSDFVAAILTSVAGAKLYAAVLDD
jgi:hypothetical protein